MNRTIVAKIVAATAALSLGGCASTQLNVNALNVSDSLEDLSTKQVLYNFNRILHDQYAVPSQAQISVGSVTSSNGVNPTFGFPFNTSLAVADAIGTTMAQAPMGLTTTNSKTFTSTRTRPNGTASLAVTDGWTQGWTLNAQTDPDVVRRLRALYRYAAGWTSADEFKCEYPIQVMANPTDTALKLPITCDSGIGFSVVADPNFERYPSCVICETAGREGQTQLIHAVNPDLRPGFIRASPGHGYDTPVTFGLTTLYLCDGVGADCKIDGRKALQDFMLFALEAQAQAQAAASKTAPPVKALGAPFTVVEP